MAVFLPLLLMADCRVACYKRVCRNASVAIGISLLALLTLTPMMCGWMPSSRASKSDCVALSGCVGSPNKAMVSLKWALNHTRLVGVVLLGTIAPEYLAAYLDPENLLPGAGHRRTGWVGYRLTRVFLFQAMRGKLQDFMQKLSVTIRRGG